MENFKNISKKESNIENEEAINIEIDLHNEEYLKHLEDLKINDPAAYNAEMQKIVDFLEDEHNRNVPDENFEILDKTHIDIPEQKEVSETSNEYYGRFVDFKNGTLEKSKLSGKVEKIIKSKEERAKAKALAIKNAIAKRNEINSKKPITDPQDPLL